MEYEIYSSLNNSQAESLSASLMQILAILPSKELIIFRT